MLHRRDLLLAGAGLALAPGAALAAKPLGAANPIVDAFVKDQGFNGVVMLGKAGKPTYARAFGMADLEAARPATVDTVYGIASISKWLTSTTVLKLVEAGKLSLDAPITTYLVDYRADTGAKVTLRRLLSNSSGVPNGFIAAAKTDPGVLTRDLPAAEAVRRYCQGDLAFEPGARFDYAMTNWIMVVAAIEAVTGQTYQDAMRATALDPLGLKTTDASQATATSPRLAAGYASVAPPVRRPNTRLSFTNAGGGYFSTASDLLKAAHQIFDTNFLAPASQTALRTIEVASDSYALGGRIRTLWVDGKPCPAGWETGNTAGYRSVLGHRFDARTSVVILNNTSLSQKTLDLFADQLFGAVTPA
ncbi:serine hydrolase domain-containing protein [Caulobacter sp. BE254]|uniref:serine hydrolase domain-containing protein n=1 Tax=Caulobacter sp. BE254 TaxID=2817720 RepID=UPI0028579C14|nr:serine hydrolase domain-containing protein [Caulobacter sp. BE254]MDR7116543.1 CubicO group peptidase (beta-lactamase class C family) [Caulobacter sp. BE254]